ncbi:CdaR family transcriptional regulator [Garciella nitratireducens]|uniref:Carbohydrate diacid regulator n=1 Tax=Garciella nitratireducens DSM 15102 TaxID=1121911 RepID=A0A1T4LUU2_9FIRM|nr:sugar diacid recognition domain-containing protein [Garciella nitratireducens]SJZ58510.1 carbohydrate diacid regulator [Garciella nitratireducens DSM 15102]
MKISKKFAQDVVMEMKKIIHQDINYIDTNGEIIASTDIERIGTFHEGGLKVAQSGENLVIEYNGQFMGTKKGINLPVYMNEEIIGVIGITGDKNEVGKFGEIIKKMTEILIKEASIREYENKQIEYKKMILEDILFNEGFSKKNILNYEDINGYSKKYGGIVIVSKIFYDEEDNVEIEEKIFRVYRDHINSNGKDLIMKHHGFIILLLFGHDYQRVAYFIESVKKEIETKYHRKVKSGIGRIKNNLEEMKNSYNEAINAFQWVIKDPHEDVLFYNNMELELILNHVDSYTQNHFIEKVCKNLKETEIEEYQKILQQYEKYNGSIKKISESLFFHKNTLQYKLDKLYQKTGFDMRNYKDFVILKIAFTLLKKN